MEFKAIRRRFLQPFLRGEMKQELLILRVCLQPSLFSMQRTWTIMSSVTCPAVHCFSTLCHKRLDVRKNGYWI